MVGGGPQATHVPRRSSGATDGAGGRGMVHEFIQGRDAFMDTGFVTSSINVMRGGGRSAKKKKQKKKIEEKHSGQRNTVA